MWLSIFLSVVVVCFTIDNIATNYLNKRYHCCPHCKEKRDDKKS